MMDWMEVAFRSFMAIGVLFLMTKLLGKRQITQLSLFEYMVGITIGDLAASISLEIGEKWYLGVVSLSVWAGTSFFIELLAQKSKKIRDTVDGKGSVLVKNGKLIEKNLKKERLTLDEFLGQLRAKDIFRVADVEFAVMETSGEVSVLLKKERQPLTASDLGMKVAPEQEPQTVIMDGNILDEPLSTIGLNRDWVLTELEKMGLSLHNVFLGQVDSYGQLFVNLYDEQIKVPEPQQKAMLLATLKKCEADIEMFALSTQDEQVKQLYAQCAAHLDQTISDVKPLLIQ